MSEEIPRCEKLSLITKQNRLIFGNFNEIEESNTPGYFINAVDKNLMLSHTITIAKVEIEVI